MSNDHSNCKRPTLSPGSSAELTLLSLPPRRALSPSRHKSSSRSKHKSSSSRRHRSRSVSSDSDDSEDERRRRRRHVKERARERDSGRDKDRGERDRGHRSSSSRPHSSSRKRDRSEERDDAARTKDVRPEAIAEVAEEEDDSMWVEKAPEVNLDDDDEEVGPMPLAGPGKIGGHNACVCIPF